MIPSASANIASRFARDEGGGPAVEFAIIAPMLLTFIVGILIVGMAYYEGATVQWSLERTLRAAMLDPEMNAEDIRAMIEEDLEAIGAPEIEFSHQIEEDGEVPLAVVTVEYDVPLMLPFAPDLSLHFTAENVSPVPAES
jgi:hypothetical protein